MHPLTQQIGAHRETVSVHNQLVQVTSVGVASRLGLSYSIMRRRLRTNNYA
jgi:hypothetical protein